MGYGFFHFTFYRFYPSLKMFFCFLRIFEYLWKKRYEYFRKQMPILWRNKLPLTRYIYISRSDIFNHSLHIRKLSEINCVRKN